MVMRALLSITQPDGGFLPTAEQLVDDVAPTNGMSQPDWQTAARQALSIEMQTTTSVEMT